MAKIAIVGAHRATKLLAPYHDPAWAVWACSVFNESELPRHDLWVEIHPTESIEVASPVYAEWLRGQPAVVMQEAYPDYPGATPYPLDKALDMFGPYFFTGTISYMMALAIMEQPEAIGLWGISPCPEFMHQKPSLWHFIEEARDRHIEIVAPPELLAAPPLYGPWPGRAERIGAAYDELAVAEAPV